MLVKEEDVGLGVGQGETVRHECKTGVVVDDVGAEGEEGVWDVGEPGERGGGEVGVVEDEEVEGAGGVELVRGWVSLSLRLRICVESAQGGGLTFSRPRSRAPICNSAAVSFVPPPLFFH